MTVILLLGRLTESNLRLNGLNLNGLYRFWRLSTWHFSSKLPLFLRKLINAAFLAWIKINVFVLLLNHDGTLSSHTIASRGMKSLKMLRAVFLKITTFSMILVFRKALCQLNGSFYKFSIWIFIVTNRSCIGLRKRTL